MAQPARLSMYCEMMRSPERMDSPRNVAVSPMPTVWPAVSMYTCSMVTFCGSMFASTHTTPTTPLLKITRWPMAYGRRTPPSVHTRAKPSFSM